MNPQFLNSSSGVFTMKEADPMPDSMGLVILINEKGKTIAHRVDNVEFLGFHFDPDTQQVSFLGRVSQDPRLKTRWVCNTAEELEIADTFAKSTPVSTTTTARR